MQITSVLESEDMVAPNEDISKVANNDSNGSNVNLEIASAELSMPSEDKKDSSGHLDNENITSDAERNVVVASNSSAEQTNETEDNAQDEDVAEANALLKDESDTDNEKTDLVDEAAIEAQMSSEVYELSLSSHVDVFKKS